MRKISKIETRCLNAPVPLYRNKQGFHQKAFADELVEKLSELVSRFNFGVTQIYPNKNHYLVKKTMIFIPSPRRSWQLI